MNWGKHLLALFVSFNNFYHEQLVCAKKKKKWWDHYTYSWFLEHDSSIIATYKTHCKICTFNLFGWYENYSLGWMGRWFPNKPLSVLLVWFKLLMTALLKCLIFIITGVLLSTLLLLTPFPVPMYLFCQILLFHWFINSRMAITSDLLLPKSQNPKNPTKYMPGHLRWCKLFMNSSFVCRLIKISFILPLCSTTALQGPLTKGVKLSNGPTNVVPLSIVPAALIL